MSNYPLPPTPPGPFGSNFGHYPPGAPDGFAPARRAAIMLWIFGGLGMLCGLCFVGAFSLLPHDQLVEAVHNGMANQPNDPFSQTPVETMILGVKVLGTLAVIVAGTMVASAFGVYRGNRAAIVIALIPCCLVLLGCALQLLLSLLLLAKGALAPAILNFVVYGFIAVVFGLTVRWLIQGFSGAAKASEEQLRQMQHWYYQQQQQQAAGYGYGTQAAPQSTPNATPWIPNLPPPPAVPPSTTGSPTPPSTFVTPPPPPPPAGGAGEGDDRPGM